MTKPNLSVIDGGLLPQSISAALDGDGSLILIRSSEHVKPTFRYCMTFVPPAAPTDIITIQGSASKTLRIKRIILSATCTTAANMIVTLHRRSAADSGGSPTVTPITPGKLDPNDAAATGVVNCISANNYSALGADVGTVGISRLSFVLFTSPQIFTNWEYATRQNKALILRGASDFICVNLGGAALTAVTPTIDC